MFVRLGSPIIEWLTLRLLSRSPIKVYGSGFLLRPFGKCHCVVRMRGNYLNIVPVENEGLERMRMMLASKLRYQFRTPARS